MSAPTPNWPPHIDKLQEEYDQWLEREGLPKVSAEELIWCHRLSHGQCVWIHGFMQLWSQALARGDAQRVVGRTGL